MSNPNAHSVFRSKLGARIDTLQAATEALETRDAEATLTIRRLAKSLMGPAAAYEVPAIASAAQGVLQAHDEGLAAAAETLIDAMRTAAGEADGRRSWVMLVGLEAQTVEALQQALRIPSRGMLVAQDGAEAQALIGKESIACLVMNPVLSDMDGRTLFSRLRETPHSATLPILFVGSRIASDIREQCQVHHADGYIEGSELVPEIVKWIESRLRRGPDHLKTSRRDHLTGLLNRAAIGDAFAESLAECTKNEEPLALALVSVDIHQHLLNRCSDDEREQVLQTIGHLLSSGLRSTDSIGRWSMYEFVALLPGEDAFGAKRAMEKLLDVILGSGGGGDMHIPEGVTVSIGVKEVDEKSALEDVISDAESLVYRSSSLGGSMVATERQQPLPTRIHRVMVLSNDMVTRKALTGLFQKSGLPTHAFSNLDEALKSGLNNRRYHLVVIDEAMPPRGGIEVLKQLRDDPANNRLLILMLIQKHHEKSIVQALESGANDYVIRPYEPNHLVSRLRRLLSRREQERTDMTRLRVHVIGPDPSALVLAGTILHEQGLKVYLSRSAQDAVGRFEDIMPDIYVVDCSASGDLLNDLLKGLPETAETEQISLIVIKDKSEAAKPIKAAPLIYQGSISKPKDPSLFRDQAMALIELPKHVSTGKPDAELLNAEIKGILGNGSK